MGPNISQRLQTLRDAEKATRSTIAQLRANVSRLAGDVAKIDPRLAPQHRQTERGRLVTEARLRAHAILGDTPQRIAVALDRGSVFRDAAAYLRLARFTRPASSANGEMPAESAVVAHEAAEAAMVTQHVMLSQRASVPQLAADATDALDAGRLAQVGVILRELDFRAANGTDTARHALHEVRERLDTVVASIREVREGRGIAADLAELQSYLDHLTGRALDDAEDSSARWQIAYETAKSRGLPMRDPVAA